VIVHNHRQNGAGQRAGNQQRAGVQNRQRPQ
jgi:hypothetical protein